MQAEFEGTTLVVRGTGDAPGAVGLRGRRAHTEGGVTQTADGWTAVVPLQAARWGGPELPLPAGEYRLQVDGADAALARELPRVLLGPLGATVLSAALSGATVRIGPPIDAVYESDEAQTALEQRYAISPAPLENAVFFESFYGRTTGCNPLAIDRELARVAPGVTRYWSVVDLSVRVPEGAIAVVEGTPEWWRVRGAARLLVVNDWLRRRYARRSGQTVLQTWHGTPLKRLALHRPGFDPRRDVAVVREGRRWSVLLAQNPYGERVMRRAYAIGRRPVWVEGYPRNDVLARGEGGERMRALLGIDPAERVLLYAPTWRDDRSEIVDFLDLERLAADTGAVVLVRGHSRTILPGADAVGTRVIDVTTYPDITDLMLAADALVTDYSSAMFDFTVTGRPVYFFVPDLEHYRGELRGFYFDLASQAPGPVTRTAEELTAVLRDPAVPERFAQRYAAWRERFNARDDGCAAERVVARILDQGFVDR
ncbi:CDP-glycerol glycerophosphotransferase family protein [Microbacterium sp. No. 7]|uniref:CDP-glycerol glycerophosphotransferase family protein n=1 Tax=Microbacterium sp. No. 7 TaxID=1714373 RepID=UPI0006CF8998|nr:CDP-glycerol glycerophosphotransferase family protein [Microbacterium sp. No. 7]ALJ19982.1 glycosyl/glycerophosphate transferase [Microbacterium sp. No. 7]